MKKTIFLLLAAMMLLFAGCSKTEGKKTDVTSPELNIRYDLGDLADLFTDTPLSAKPGDTVEIRTVVIFDADIHVYVNSEEIQKTHYDSDYWGYSFVMPDTDVEVTASPYTKEEIWGQ